MGLAGVLEPLVSEHAEHRENYAEWCQSCRWGRQRAAEVAAAVLAWLETLAQDEVAQKAAAVYWNHRQGVPLTAWTPPIEVESMRAALTAFLAAAREA